MKLPTNLIKGVIKHGTLEDILALNVVDQYVSAELRQALEQYAPMNEPLANIPGEAWINIIMAVIQSGLLHPAEENTIGNTSTARHENNTDVVVVKCPKCNQFFLKE